MLHCTYRRPDGCYLKLPHDYRTIAAYDVANAIAIRVCEQKTEDRIVWLRRNRGVPDDHLPPDDWLWLDESEVSPAAMVEYGGHARERTTLARTLSEQSPNPTRPSLIELGYVQFRYIARRSRYATPARVFTELHHDHEGKAFIIVEDYQGYYLDAEGELHCSIEEGYSEVVKQYLYCFEAVNTAIAAIDGSRPPALPRWQQKTSAGQGTHRNCNLPAPGDAKENTSTNATVSGGYLYSVVGVSAFTSENTTNQGNTSIIANSEANGHALRHAPWTVETILALLARHLTVPTKPDESDKAAMDRYLVQWYEPALWMCHATNDLEPRRAWETIERRVVGMLRGPTWYAKHRATQGPITARNVVGPASSEKPLNGANWENVWKELDKTKWWPDAMTPYDGPPLEYEAGYTGVTQATDESSAPLVEETPPAAPPQGMKQRTAERLRDRIWEEYPTLFLGLLPLSEDRYAVSIQIGDNAWHDLTNSVDWHYPGEALQTSLDQALHYAAERSIIPTEVGVIEEQEPPPIILEPPDNVAPSPDDEETYVSMEEISADLERGLRPLGTPPMAVVEISQPIQNEPYEYNPAPPPGKTGMSLVIAQFLLDRIISEGYQAQLRPISDDRAILAVEASPGQWIEIESGVAWQRHLKSVAQSPPSGSVASVIAMHGTGQAMEVAQ